MASGRFRRLRIVYGIMADKALDDIIPLMPREAEYWFVTPDTPRALPAGDIASRYLTALERTDPVKICGPVAEALTEIEKIASPDDLIYIGGSTFVVCEAIRYYESL